MRRKDRELPSEEAAKILERCEYGVLSCVSPENKPYSVPVNYVCSGEKDLIYIHCAKSGRKLDCISENSTVQLAAVGKAQVVEGFETLYESAIAEGAALILEDEAEKRQALLILCEKYYPGTMSDEVMLEKTNKYIDKYFDRTAIIKIKIESITGKAHKTI